MSISFQSTSASTGSRNDTKHRLLQQQFPNQTQQQQQQQQSNQSIISGQQQHPSFLGAIFNKRERKLSKSDEGSTNATAGRSTEVWKTGQSILLKWNSCRENIYEYVIIHKCSVDRNSIINFIYYWTMNIVFRCSFRQQIRIFWMHILSSVQSVPLHIHVCTKNEFGFVFKH